MLRRGRRGGEIVEKGVLQDEAIEVGLRACFFSSALKLVAFSIALIIAN